MRALLAFVVAILLAGPAASAGNIKVVASFSIIGDMVARVGGENVKLRTLVGPDIDAHTFEPSAADAKAVANATLVFIDGDVDHWANRLAKAAGANERIIMTSKGVPRLFRPGGEANPTPVPRPHIWQDVNRAQKYVDNIAIALANADPANASNYKTNAAAYIAELRALDMEVRTEIGKVPPPRRIAITSHDAFEYFGVAYQVKFLSPVGISTEEQPSAKGVAQLITQIKREKITAVFVENITDPRLIEQIARETGVKIGGKLYSDALSTKDGPAPTYIAMMRHNVKLLTAAMAQGH